MQVREGFTNQSTTSCSSHGSLIGSLGLTSEPDSKIYQRLMQWTVVSNNGSLNIVVVRVLQIGTLKQEAVARKEIAKKQQLRDAPDSNSFSGWDMHFDIASSSKFPFVTTREKSKAPEVAATTSPLLQSEEGGEGTKFDSEHPPADDAEEGNNDVEESGDDDNEAEEFDEKGNSIEESGEWRRTLTLPPHQMRGPKDGSYRAPRMFIMREKNAPSKSVIKKMLVLDSIQVRAILVDISERTINRVLMGGDYTVSIQTTEYDYHMEALKETRKLITQDKLMHVRWMANIITKAKEKAEWVTSRNPICKA
ncbi:hypothetical protein HAX54_035263 [Datura stramonium]|uniref:Uncharacterized protein n=1 Tax=Datura stramonium TaxID=4076 RepID=A0ABS8VI21_DATST|nr:hypothetical protein [Datura stramonium]